MFNFFGRKNKSSLLYLSDEELLKRINFTSGTSSQMLQENSSVSRNTNQQALFIKYQRRTIYASLLVGIFSCVGVIFSILAYYDTVRTSELLNRPYLNLNVPWFVFLDRNGKEYKVGQDPDVNDIKYFKIATKVTNFGKLPAERIEFTATSTPSVFSFRNTKKNIIYDELKSESQIFSTEKLGDIFKNKSEFTIKLELKYHLLGSSKIYIAFSESKCIARLLGTAIQISCGLMQEGTD